MNPSIPSFILEAPSGLPDYLWFLVGALLVCTALLTVSLAARKKVIAWEDASGKVSVTRRALRELIQESCSILDHVSSSKARLHSRRERLDIEIDLKLESSGRIEQIRDDLRAALEETLSRNLGFKQIGRISFNINAVRIPEENLKRMKERRRGRQGTGGERAYVEAASPRPGGSRKAQGL